jgi:hypothetical protein
MQEHEDHPFYGEHILRNREQAYIQRLLSKFRGRIANEELKKEIYEELQRDKHIGKLKIPFKVVLRQDPSGKYPNYVEVILDTKV